MGLLLARGMQEREAVMSWIMVCQMAQSSTLKSCYAMPVVVDSKLHGWMPYRSLVFKLSRRQSTSHQHRSGKPGTV